MKATENRSPLRARGGFTLLEVMIALAIIGTTVTVILHTVNYHADIMYANALGTSMIQTAKEKLDELKRDRTASKGIVTESNIYFEKQVLAADDPGITVLRVIVTGQGKMITLGELVRTRQPLSQ